MKNRLFKNWITTLLGLALNGVVALGVNKDWWTMEQASGWIATGCMLLRSKDTIIGLKSRED